MNQGDGAATGVRPERRRQYDIVLFGASGFTGALTAEYLARHGSANLRWALAGRNMDKLAALRERLMSINPACQNLELLPANVDDAESLRRIAESAAVLITTVGPYLHFGEPLVAACAAAGSDYLDLTGEPEFVDRMWLKYHQQALTSGARIVNSCGFDCIPHDLGVLFTVQQLPPDVPLSVQGFVRFRGSFSGGTIHSMVAILSRLREAASAAKQRLEREPRPLARSVGLTPGKIHYARAHQAWAVPAPTIDPQMICRSAASNLRYGPQFLYGHYFLLRRLITVGGLLAMLSAIVIAAQFRLTRQWLLRSRNAGEGPSAAQREHGWFSVRFSGVGGGQQVMTEVAGGEPFYTETAKMLAEAALCLAFDPLSRQGGVLTPVQAMGEALLSRLQRAGIRFSVLPADH